MIIRECIKDDIEELSSIALSTAIAGKDGQNYFLNKDLISQYYCEPYIRYNSEYCFAIEEDNRLCGYIVGTSNSLAFSKWFNEYWLVKLRLEYFNSKSISDVEKNLLNMLNKDVVPSEYFEKYPAHLHINVIKNMQGKKIGKKLINTLLQKLTDDNIKGVHLGVDINNSKAIGFYNHLGFEIIEEKPWGYLMGKTLSTLRDHNNN